MTINEILTLTINSVLIPLIYWGVASLRKYLLARAKSAQMESAILLADSAVLAGVGEVGQIFVDALKEEGSFTPEKAAEAFGMARARAYKILGDAGIELLKQATGDVKAYIEARIEEAVRETRTPTAQLQAEAEHGVC